MRPLWVSVGDYDNVVGFTRVLGRGGGDSLILESTDLTKVIDREKSTIDVDDPEAENSLVQLAFLPAWKERELEFSIAGVPPAVDAYSFYCKEFRDTKQEELFPGKKGVYVQYSEQEERKRRVSAGLQEDWDRLTNRQKSKWTAMGETSATNEMAAKEHLLTGFGEALHTIHITDDPRSDFEYEYKGGLQLNLKFSIEGFQKRKPRLGSYGLYEVEDPCDIERFEDDAWQTINALVQVGDGNSPTQGTREGVELLRFLPCTPETGDIKEDAEEDDGSSYFHRDSVGKTCFSAKEAERTTKRLAEMKFIDRILDEIKTTKFLHPQQDVEEAATYCNEQVYGNFTFLQVTGIVSLD
jgi:hypothetical protein